MYKKSLLVVCLLSAAGGAFALSGGTTELSNQTLPRSVQLQPSPNLPDYVPYMFLFHHIKVLKDEAENIDRQGKGKSALLTRLKERSSLNEVQFQVLYNEALKCERQVAELDERAHVILNTFSQRYPSDASGRGQDLPPPPAELLSMQEERQAIILRARDHLRAVLGAQEFGKLHSFVMAKIAPNVGVADAGKP